MVWFCLVVAVAVLIVSGVLVGLAFYYGGRARWIVDSTAASAGQMAAGPAKLTGKAVALDELLQSPLSDKPCIYYRFQVEEKKTQPTPHGAHSYWKTVVDDKQSVPCGIDDGTGIAALTLAGAELILSCSAQVKFGFFQDPPASIQQILRQRYDVSTKGWFFNKTMRCSEFIIEPGEPLFVVGVVEMTPGGHPHFERSNGLLIVTKKDEKGLISHYRNQALLCWLGVVIILAIGGGLAAWAVWG